MVFLKFVLWFWAFSRLTSALSPCEVIKHSPQFIQNETINLVYTMETNCTKCYGDARMLDTLKQQVLKEGIHINIVVGMDIPPYENFIPAVINVGDAWNALGKENGHIFIIDSCGRFTYQVVKRWSSLVYPFVKAAVLATAKTNPCGQCQVPLRPTNTRDELVEYDEFVDVPPLQGLTKASDGTVPLSVIIKKQHRHRGSSKIYDWIETQTSNLGYHGHPDDSYDSSEESTLGQNDIEQTKEESETGVSTVVSSMPESDEAKNEKEKLAAHYRSLLKWVFV